MTSTVDASKVRCFEETTGHEVAPCPATAVPLNSYRFGCYAKGIKTPGRALAADVTQRTPPSGWFPSKLVFVPKAPRSDDGVIAARELFGHIPAGLTVTSIATPQNFAPTGLVENCNGSGSDYGVQLYRTAGATEDKMVWLYQREGAGAKGYDKHGFWIAGIPTQLWDGSEWTAHPKIVALLSAYLAKHPTFDGCKAYPCGGVP